MSPRRAIAAKPLLFVSGARGPRFVQERVANDQVATAKGYVDCIEVSCEATVCDHKRVAGDGLRVVW